MTIPSKPAETVKRARTHRRTLTPPEVKLWSELRARPGGLKFRRQHPAGAYVLDFYCAEARLAIEVDGGFHDRGDAPARDARRDAWLAGHGVLTPRVRASDVMRELENVLTYIVEIARARLPLHHSPAASGPPPQAKLGED